MLGVALLPTPNLPGCTIFWPLPALLTPAVRCDVVTQRERTLREARQELMRGRARHAQHGDAKGRNGAVPRNTCNDGLPLLPAGPSWARHPSLPPLLDAPAAPAADLHPCSTLSYFAGPSWARLPSLHPAGWVMRWPGCWAWWGPRASSLQNTQSVSLQVVYVCLSVLNRFWTVHFCCVGLVGPKGLEFAKYSIGEPAWM